MYDMPASSTSPAASPAGAPAAIDGQLRAQLLQFSADVSDAMTVHSYMYLKLVEHAAALSQTVHSPAAQRDLMDLRVAASEIAEACAWMSRSIRQTADDYRAVQLGDAHDPQPLRGTFQEITESCVLIANAASLHDLAELPVLEPQVLLHRVEDPAMVRWLEHNRPSAPTPQLPAATPSPPSPAPAPPPAQPHPSSLPQSPYPSLDQQPTPQSPYPPAPYPPAQPSAPAPGQPSAPAGPGVQPVGERTRGTGRP